MTGVRVKICGITRSEDLETSVAAGADAVGFVVGVPSSPRNVTAKTARELIQNTPLFVTSVVVTVPTNLAQLTKISTELNPDVIQIHGNHLSDTFVRGELSKIRLIRAIRVGVNDVIQTSLLAADTFDAVLLDTYSCGKQGGTGTTHDWEVDKLVKQAIHPRPLILAGGLTPENVKDAIHIVHPYAVDVSSGLESRPGIKDSKKVFRFIENVKDVLL